MTLNVLPGRIAVLWPLSAGGLLEVPDWVRRQGEQVRGDKLEARKVTVYDSKFPGVYPGDQVCVRADAACLALEHGEYDFIPEGHEIRIYGVHEPILDGSRRGDEERGQDIVMWREA